MARGYILAAGLALGLVSAPGLAQDSSLDDFLDGKTRQDGLFPIYLDDAEGRVYGRFQADETGSYGRFIHTARLTSGLGSNPVGLDRGYGVGGRILSLARRGGRLFIEVENHDYRAVGAGEDERRATAQSFGRSVIWSGEIAQEDGEAIIVDLTGFLVSDAIDAAGALDDAGQGSFSMDRDRSALLTEEALAFPENLEFDVLMTLATSAPGPEVRATAPQPEAVTLTLHHSFLALPDDGYTPRRADARSGAFATGFYDMASPLEGAVRQGYANRHRLQTTADGEVIEPIVYHVDRGAPDRIRDALIEGGNWWSEAFDAAGFEGGYRVELLPEGIHPLDVRYNVIQWVHRQTRGWSYGASVVDPRTGEIVKGHVILGSQRVRQDRMIFEAMLGADATGTGDPDTDPLQIALARIRQLSAHEIGHTIGFAHNFAASADGRASVMDYPHPLIRTDFSGGFDLSDAYDVGIGEWDVATVRWLYTEFEPEEEAAGLEAILDEAREDGLRFISDRHARGNSSAHPVANLWDNGEDAVEELAHVMAVREQALAYFGHQVMADDRPLGELRNVLPPIFLFHRYQVEAAGKSLGGVDFDYEMNGPSARGVSPWPAERQRAALAALAATLEPDALDLPDAVISLMAPESYADYNAAAQREHFRSNAYPAFSPTGAAAAAAEVTLNATLNPARMARVADQSARDPEQLGTQEVFDAIEAALRGDRRMPARERAIRETVQTVYARSLLDLAAHTDPRIAAPARDRLENARAWADMGSDFGDWLSPFIAGRLAEIDEGETVTRDRNPVPPGSPIGMHGADSCWHCDSSALMGLERD
jgi:hypothetical protein